MKVIIAPAKHHETPEYVFVYGVNKSAYILI